jgi:hypothetical protein
MGRSKTSRHAFWDDEIDSERTQYVTDNVQVVKVGTE